VTSLGTHVTVATNKKGAFALPLRAPRAAVPCPVSGSVGRTVSHVQLWSGCMALSRCSVSVHLKCLTAVSVQEACCTRCQSFPLVRGLEAVAPHIGSGVFLCLCPQSHWQPPYLLISSVKQCVNQSQESHGGLLVPDL
jgi:hypothetical protein